MFSHVFVEWVSSMVILSLCASYSSNEVHFVAQVSFQVWLPVLIPVTGVMSVTLLTEGWGFVDRLQSLIDREWIQAGHPFRSRCFKSAYSVSKQRLESPVFLLLIDCIWQVRKNWSI